MATTIVLKNSVTTTNAPSSLAQGEVAINVTDKKVWVGNAATTPIQIVNGGPDGVFTSVTDSGLTNTRVTYAGAGGLLKDSANITTDGTILTATKFSGALNGTVGATTPAAGTFTTVSASSTITATGGFIVGASAAPTFSAIMSATQTITSGTFTKVNFNTEEWDTNSNYDTSTYRFTPTVAGYYQVSCSIDAGASTASVRVISNIYKNGSQYRVGQNTNTAAGGSFSGVCSALVYMNGSTDYIECYGYVGATIAIISPSPATWFDACLVRSA